MNDGPEVFAVFLAAAVFVVFLLLFGLLCGSFGGC